VAVGWSLKPEAKAALGRAGWVRGGRREPVPGGLAAASMPRTPPRTHPAQPLTVSVCVQPRKRKRKSKAGRALRALVVGSDPFSAGKRIRPLLVSVPPTASERAVEQARRDAARASVTGKLSRVGREGQAGPLAPWMAPSSPHGWVYGVSCLPLPACPVRKNPEP